MGQNLSTVPAGEGRPTCTHGANYLYRPRLTLRPCPPRPDRPVEQLRRIHALLYNDRSLLKVAGGNPNQGSLGRDGGQNILHALDIAIRNAQTRDDGPGKRIRKQTVCSAGAFDRRKTGAYYRVPFSRE